jgi:hypothetical protein
MTNFYFAEFFFNIAFGGEKGSCTCSIHRTGAGASKPQWKYERLKNGIERSN